MDGVAPSTNSLIPVNDCVLVKLDRTEKRESKYDTRTSGIAIAVSSEYPKNEVAMKLNSCIGKRVYFEEYKEGARIKKDGELFCFIKIEDIRGFEDV